ncbi:hypothetical protein [Stutzerimonas nitrititolerans]|uniref:hypothetical protein n=1 Tax=Stutzerimonas nitrititolerans TaxID=2482751 RepID=UPI00289725F3|nr:hypothetical protein [Stutzerimonas nitrititolerans]
MGDRELLEMAAKAAGISGGWGDKIEYHNGAVDLRDVWILEGDDLVPWNPLTDDGDALRLAVRLGITVAFWEYPQNSVAAYVSGDGIPASSERHGEDKDAATRRAIVRAAAAIGRAM